MLGLHPAYHRYSYSHFSFGRPYRLVLHGDFLAIRLPEVVAKACSGLHESSALDPKAQLSVL